jgi:P27 family predicted phage terminase small subunit
MGGKGSGGSNRKPTALKKLLGNPGKRKLNEKEPAAPKGVPEMPRFLTTEARAEWRRIIPILVDMCVLTVADGKALAGYCSAYAQLAKAEAAIEKYGLICVTALDPDTGVVELKTNPAVRIKSDALRQMKSFLIEFGLTPASRSKLKINASPDTPDALDALFDAPTQPVRKPN